MAKYTQVKDQADATGDWSWLEMQPATMAPITVASLPSASANTGKSLLVSNATLSPILGLGLAVVGGGANIVRVWSNGTSWLIG